MMPLMGKILLALLVSVKLLDHHVVARDHERPYFMPAAERDRVHAAIATEVWAKTDFAKLRKAASGGDGFAAAFIYALDGDPRDSAVAQKWLLGKYGKTAYWTVRAAERLNGD